VICVDNVVVKGWLPVSLGMYVEKQTPSKEQTSKQILDAKHE
jgi:hypothetical protein